MPTTERETLVAEAVIDLTVHAGGRDFLDVLHDLTAHLVTLLDVRAVGMTILDEAGRLDYLTASDEMCRRLEEDQLELGEGPCVDSTRTGTVLPRVALGPGTPGLRRWPRFTPRALCAGILSVAAVPLHVSDNMLVAVNLMSATSGAPTEQDLRLAQLLADATGARLQQRQVLRARDEICDQMETALDTRIVIEQAKGALAARLGVDVEEAFIRLRSHARARQQTLGDLATHVTRGAVPSGLGTVPRRAGP
ncbi:transcriptional regulator [Streptomyces minutiscleroticus]|uniref:Transcriptional regulator n=1 Tax=Streptomyces minutiscleroticus TaxID=68238 RepID=A0A918NMK2_9ACTN|nr:GAF and ANTAR domain-containing protein [Streptomyces minutiscleroticus]GGX81201.1 transcriptional regulator [Streptomyces minutiscleroticus]